MTGPWTVVWNVSSVVGPPFALQRARVERAHRAALALVEVLRRRRRRRASRRTGRSMSELGGGRAPRVVRAAADLEVEAEARERDAARVEAAAVQVVLHQDLGRVVADLRAGDEDRVAARRALRADQERVRHQPCAVRDCGGAPATRREAPGVDRHVAGAVPVGPARTGTPRDASPASPDRAARAGRSRRRGPSPSPSRCCSAERNSALRASSPPPAPNTRADQRADRDHVVARRTA